ncbi:MAG: 4Fe-4S binding protein [Bacteroidota bacterium]
MTRIALTSHPVLKRALINRWPQWLAFLVMLAGMLFTILAGFIGTPVGNRNFGIVFIWIAWWAVLILVAVPFFGRAWCAICPIPLPGEWLQRGNVLGPRGQARASRRRRWPRALRNIWLQNVSFTLVALFSAIILTNPTVTSIVLSAMLFTGIALGMVFERRTFCRYLCPIGGFIGLYSQVAPVELRIKDRSACRTCELKPCYNGSSQGYGCPWDVFPGGLSRNTYCGLCMECLRTCPKDNIAINLRPFAADLVKPSARLDEAFKAFIMLGSAMVYAGVLLGPWGGLKSAAFHVGSGSWLVYAGMFLAVIFALLPGIYALVVWAGTRDAKAPLRTRFAEFTTALIPLGLMFWAAFSLSFVLTNASYVLAALSDPLGWGWNLFGGASIAWKPVLTPIIMPLQTAALAGGLLWSGNSARRIAAQRGASAVPMIGLSLVLTGVMLWLLI